MSKRQKDLCSSKVASRLKQAGATFPSDDFETTSSSGKESHSVYDKRKKIKSGAKVKTRPVVRTELWPHIANEDDGEDVTSENITLAKFFSCFTFIMASCSRLEAKVRPVLLHPISTVLEYLQWSESHIFHNMIMTKIEQGRIEWDADFMSLADDFIDKKVRLGLRSRYTPAASNSSSKSSYYREVP